MKVASVLAFTRNDRQIVVAVVRKPWWRGRWRAEMHAFKIAIANSPQVGWWRCVGMYEIRRGWLMVEHEEVELEAVR
jgi:hypothetical protein